MLVLFLLRVYRSRLPCLVISIVQSIRSKHASKNFARLVVLFLDWELFTHRVRASNSRSGMSDFYCQMFTTAKSYLLFILWWTVMTCHTWYSITFLLFVIMFYQKCSATSVSGWIASSNSRWLLVFILCKICIASCVLVNTLRAKFPLGSTWLLFEYLESSIL